MDENAPCRDYQRGDCFRSKCKFLHEGDIPRNEASRDMCRDFQKGRCDRAQRGMRCRFSHGDGDFGPSSYDPRPPYGGGPRGYPRDDGYGMPPPPPRCYYDNYYQNPPYSDYGYRSPRYEKEPCRDFKFGRCGRGDSCKFDHSGSTTQRCADFFNGRCNRGEECRYRHGLDEVEVCRDFLKDDCSRGNSCRFSHSGGGEQPNQTSQQGQTLQPESTDGEVCRDFLKGNCDRLNCRFSHGKRGRDDEADFSANKSQKFDY